MTRRQSSGTIVRTTKQGILHAADGTEVPITYIVARSGRRTTSLSVSRESILTIHTTRTASQTYIEGLLQQNNDWILHQMQRQQERQAAAQEAVAGLTIEEREQRVRAAAEQIRPLLAQRIAHYEPMLPQPHREIRRIRIGMQRSRWGSCSSTGTISFNVRLYLAPPEALDYVVVHELCHLVEMNHSDRFWALVASIMPDYLTWRRWLRENGDELRF